MTFVSWIFLSTAFAVLLYYVKKFIDNRSANIKLPPGPPGWPILGNVDLLMGTDQHERLRSIGERYGGIFTITVGIRKTVWLTKYRLIREALINHSWEFAGRPGDMIKMNDLHKGLAASGVNEEEKEVRRFTLVTLRNYGFGKTTMQDALLQEASNLIEGFKRKLGVPFDPRNDFTTAAGNIISGMLMGKQFQEGDEGFRTASESITEALQIGAKAIVEDAFPVMKLISNAKRKMHQHFGIAESYIKNIINEHVSSRVPDKPRDFIDTWLDQEEKSSNRTAQPAFLRSNLPAVVVDIFTGGFETTATSFQWLFATLLNYPEIQDRIHAELDEVVGRGSQATLEHRDVLVYTEAVILEAQRYFLLAPMAAPHMCTKDATIGGHLLTAGTSVTIHVYSVHNDPELWDQPAKFIPERFIKDGKLVIPDYFLAFSAGRRSCMGEQLARKQLFLFFANIMQSFKIATPAGAGKPSLKKYDGLVTYPAPFDIVVELR